MKFTVFALTLLMAVSAYSFPMRGLEKNAVIDLHKFTMKNGSPVSDKSPLKMLLIWRSDKRLSKKQYKVFKEFCTEEKMKCISVDRLGEFQEEAGIISAFDKTGYTDTWGLITIPVTVILDGNNKIIDAIGYEGQYKHRMREYMSNLQK